MSCFCAAVNHLSYDYRRVDSIYRSCEAGISQLIAAYKTTGQANERALKQLPARLVISSTLAAHCSDRPEADQADGEYRMLTIGVKLTCTTTPLQASQ